MAGPGFETKETSPHLLLGAQDKRLGTEQDQLPCGSTGTSSGNCQETETCMVRACHTPRQPLQNHPLGHLGGWATLLSAEEMLDGQHQRVDIYMPTPELPTSCRKDRKKKDLFRVVLHLHLSLNRVGHFFLAYLYSFSPFTCIFSKPLPICPVLAVANTWFLCRPPE